MRVLVTDAEYKLTLGIIRSLGRRGIEVVAVGASRRALGFYSRYASETRVCPAPEKEQAFVEFVLDAVERHRIDVVLPVGQDSTAVLSKHRERITDHAGIPVADWSNMQVALSKKRTLALAQRLGVPIPTTYELPEQIETFPVVAKKSMGSGVVRYINDPGELEGVTGDDWVLQEYVAGEGRGLFALFDHGEERALFMHRRLREYPVTGGASTAAESIDDPELGELGVRVLRALGWHGVAMVEFKLDRRDGAYKLMEINPKFWGSIDLPITAGIDFPWLAVRLALGKPIQTQPYQLGLRFQWVFSDLLHVAAMPRNVPAFLRDLINPNVENDIWLSDLRPNAIEGLFFAAAIATRLKQGTLRHPHGRPSGIRPAS